MKLLSIHRKRGPFRRFGQNENGTAAVEFALCLPLLMILLFLGIETGRLLLDFQAVSKSLRDAGRYLGHVGIDCGNAPSTGPLANYINAAADETTARNLALTGTPDTPATTSDYLLPYWDGTAGSLTMTVTCATNATYQGVYEGVPLIAQINVAAAVPFTFLWGTTFAATTGVNVNLTHTQTHFGTF